MIFYRRGEGYDYENNINTAVFPMCQGGPHENTIAALAVQFKECATPEFEDYISQVRKNAVALAAALQAKGHEVVTGGTDNHMVLWDVRPRKLTGSKLEKILDYCNITVNKNTIYATRTPSRPEGFAWEHLR